MEHLLKKIIFWGLHKRQSFETIELLFMLGITLSCIPKANKTRLFEMGFNFRKKTKASSHLH